MSGYRVVINTESYKKKRCSKRNWEPGTLNNFMKALNGWKIIEPNLKKLRWRIEFFAGNGGAWDDPEWEEWLNQPKNSFKYQDELCGFERIAETHSFKKEWLFTISFPFVFCTSGLEFRLPHLSRLLHSTFRTQLFR